ncbi:MAG: VOC family protein [Lewinellaceae bacterium]|nr:VOC family protein [Saprospiraceae bacterium]MCB9341826.1 VOC family protein [Lewinellaceae bacterium]
MKPSAILETCLCATDLEAAAAFYTKVLGLEMFAKEPGRHAFFRCGQGVFLLFNPEVTIHETSIVNGSPIPLHGTSGAGHVCFRVGEEEIPAWRERLQNAGVEIESEVEWPAGGTSLYFRDPEGNCIELAPSVIWGLPNEQNT